MVISFLAFALVRAVPGGPFDRDRKPASPEIERNLRAKYHLDEPLWQQYLRYLGGILHGDFGPSLKYRNHSVSDIIGQGLPVSLTLGAAAFCFALGAGIPLGFWTAARRGRWQDYGGSLAALLVICVPGLVIGPILIMLFAIKLRWFPVALWGSPWHAILPTLTLGLYFSGRIARLMREGMLDTLQAEFITTARAKGLGEIAVLVQTRLSHRGAAGAFLFRADAGGLADGIVRGGESFSNTGDRRVHGEQLAGSGLHDGGGPGAAVRGAVAGVECGRGFRLQRARPEGEV